MGKVTVLKETITNPITYFGKVAGIAYDSDTTQDYKNKRRGLNCIRANHGRLLEFADVHLEISGYSARVIREFMRHVSDGLTVIQRSTRYVEEDNLLDNVYIPKAINADWEGARDRYLCAIQDLECAYSDLINRYNISKEDAANLLPLGLYTTIVVKHNARCYIDMAKVRLCNRAYEEYRQLMRDIMEALSDYSVEWKELVEEFFKCKCDVQGYCDEEYSCGKYPKKFDEE